MDIVEQPPVYRFTLPNGQYLETGQYVADWIKAKDDEIDRLRDELAERARDEVALIEQAARLTAERDALYRLCLTMYSAHHTQSVVDAALKEGK